MEERDFYIGDKKKLWGELDNMGFKEVDEPLSTNKILNMKEMFIVHPTVTYVIVAKTNRAKKLFKPFFDEEDYEKVHSENFKEMNWKIKDIKAYEETSNYNPEIILNFLKFVNIIDDNITIQIKTDYPLKIETKDFILILAPRVKD